MPRAKEVHEALFTPFIIDQRLIVFLLITRLLTMQKCANFELLRVEDEDVDSMIIYYVW